MASFASASTDNAEKPPSDIDLLLIGKTGNGKSAAGNSIVKFEAFEESESTGSETFELKWAIGRHSGKTLKVVDGPGVGDTRMDKEKRVKQMHTWINQAIKMNDRGYHAFLLVLKYGNRFTDEETEVIEFLKDIFGENFAKDHCIVLMTYGDNFKSKSKKTRKTFHQWCEEQEGGFHDLIQECRGRVVLFDNIAEDEDNTSQIDKLMGVIKTMGGKRYTNKLFDDAAELRRKKFVSTQKPFIEMRVMERVCAISLKLNEEVALFQNGDYNHKDRLEELYRDCDVLIEEVKRDDKSTGVLKSVEDGIQLVKQSIRRTCLLIDSAQKQTQEETKKAQAEVQARAYAQAKAQAEKKKAEDEKAKAENKARQLEMQLASTNLKRQEEQETMTKIFNEATRTGGVEEMKAHVRGLEEKVIRLEKETSKRKGCVIS